MGKKRSVGVGRISALLNERQPGCFTSDFEENKKVVGEMIQLPSKAARNKIAGYVTHHTHHKTLGFIRHEGDEEE